MTTSIGERDPQKIFWKESEKPVPEFIERS
jgi:hypothetical protein